MWIYSQGREDKILIDSPCLATSKKKPKTRGYIRNLNSLAINKPKPKYPDEAKERDLRER